MDLITLVNHAAEKKASDIHVIVGIPLTLRIDGELIPINESKLTPADTESLVREALGERLFNILELEGEVDSSYSSPGVARFRINAFKQRGSYGMALRVIPLEIPGMDYLRLPDIVRDVSQYRRGLVLVTGPTGSGKSTTLAAIINKINRERNCHILTLEDPIEYLHRHNKSIVNQREVGNDSSSFSKALRAALRQDPDVILVGEMRDLETISIALTAAETGHLVLSTLHTSGAAKTIDRIIDVFPPHQQQQVRVQLSSVTQAIISQQLLAKSDGEGRVAAFEILVTTPAISNLIREDKVHQIDTVIQTGSAYGMQTMDNSLVDLYKKGLISKDTLLAQAHDQEQIKKYFI